MASAAVSTVPGTPALSLTSPVQPAIDDWIADPEMLLRPPARIEPDGQALPQDLQAGGGIARGHAQVEELAVVLKLQRQRLVGERLEIAGPVVEFAVDRDGVEPGTAFKARFVGRDERRADGQQQAKDHGLVLHRR